MASSPMTQITVTGTNDVATTGPTDLTYVEGVSPNTFTSNTTDRYYGNNMVITPDGKTFAFSQVDTNQAEQVNVYEYANGSWSAKGSPIPFPSAYDSSITAVTERYFGKNMAISDDGTKLFCGFRWTVAYSGILAYQWNSGTNSWDEYGVDTSTWDGQPFIKSDAGPLDYRCMFVVNGDGTQIWVRSNNQTIERRVYSSDSWSTDITQSLSGVANQYTEGPWTISSDGTRLCFTLDGIYGVHIFTDSYMEGT